MGLHRQLADRLPESLAEKLRKLRNNWYQLRFQLKADSL
jgi:ribosomal protein L29